MEVNHLNSVADKYDCLIGARFDKKLERIFWR